MQNRARTIYPYPSLEAMLEGEAAAGRKPPLPGPGDKPVMERRTETGRSLRPVISFE
jgi:hypothetical protein